MDEATRRLESARHLANAEQLIGRGKGRRALDQLWQAEALARGDPEAIHKLLESTRAFEGRVEPRQSPRLVELVAALEHDARHATESSPLPPPLGERARERAQYLGLVFSSLLAAGLGAAIFIGWAFHVSDPCPCTGDFCIFGNPASSGADAHLNTGGAAVGMILGGVGLLLVSGYLAFRLRLLVILIVGFPVLYGLLLLSIWAVARLAWGPTTCT
jgi:hypothetical protein